MRYRHRFYPFSARRSQIIRFLAVVGAKIDTGETNCVLERCSCQKLPFSEYSLGFRQCAFIRGRNFAEERKKDLVENDLCAH